MTIVKSSLVCDICEDDIPANCSDAKEWCEVSYGEYDTQDEKIYDLCPYCANVFQQMTMLGLTRSDVRVATRDQIEKRGY